MIIQKDNAVYLSVRVSPNTKRSGIEGIWQETRIKIALRAPAVEGKANQALIDFLADFLGVKKRNIQIIQGETAREKTIAVTGKTADQIQQIIAPYL